MANNGKDNHAIGVYTQSNHDLELRSTTTAPSPKCESVLTNGTSNDEKSIATDIGIRNLNLTAFEVNEYGMLEVPQNPCPSCLESLDHPNRIHSCRHRVEPAGNVHHHHTPGLQTDRLNTEDCRFLWKTGVIDVGQFKHLSSGEGSPPLSIEVNRKRFQRKPHKGQVQ